MSAGDFYFAINATFRFIRERHGEEALIAYWRSLGKGYHAPLIERFREGGLEEVETYWRNYFDREPGGDVEVSRTEDRVEIDVRDCPALAWLRGHDREVAQGFCEHCLHVSESITEECGMRFELEGGGGSCHQTFLIDGMADGGKGK